jgi:hypothetical protein
VNPDLDDRLIKPNEAKSSYNIRFTTGTDQDNYSGGSKINDLILVPYSQPSGFNRSVGVKMDWQNRVLIRADWNSNGFHRFIRISETSVDVIVEGSWLGFDINKDVSIDVVGGLLFWTNVPNMQPMTLDIARSIAGQYPVVFKESNYTLIKRQPGLNLIMGANGVLNINMGLEEASVDYQNIFGTDNGTQFGYYYQYINGYESRISPVGPVTWFQTNVIIEIPNQEFQEYLASNSLVEYVVFVYRKSNISPWYNLKRIKNIPSSYTVINGVSSFRYVVPNILTMPLQGVSSNITNAETDEVPLFASCLRIAADRLMLGCITQGYDNWDQLSLALTPTLNPIIVTTTQIPLNPPPPRGSAFTTITVETTNGNSRTFMFGYYNVGIEILDQFGRKIGVLNSQTILIPKPIITQTQVADRTGQTPFPAYVPPSTFAEDKDSIYKIDYQVSGNFPSWAKYYRVVYSKNLNLTSFTKTVAKIYYWATSGNEDFLSINARTGKDGNGKAYSARGYAVELTSGEPFLFDANSEQYVEIAPEYFVKRRSGDVAQKVTYARHKIVKQVNNILYVESGGVNLIPAAFKGGNGNDINNWGLLYYQVFLCTPTKSFSEIYYQSTAIDLTSGPLTGSIYGDCYINKWKKTNGGSQVDLLYVVVTGSSTGSTSGSGTLAKATYNTNDISINGYGLSMNPVNIYSQVWDSDIGQVNVVNDLQRQAIQENFIIPSDPIILGSQINGLNKFNSIDAQPMPAENGAIVDLITTNSTQTDPGVMIAMSKLSHQSIYLNATQFTNTDGSGNISGSTNVLGTNRPLIGKFGIERIKNSMVTPDGIVYFYSPLVKDLIRYAENGLVRLGQTFSFANTLRQDFGTETNVFVNFDQITNEVILIAKDKKAYIFFDPRGGEKSFQGFRDYFKGTLTPELGANFGTSVYYFVEGEIWKTDNQSVNNSFFGTLKDPSLEIVSNVEPTSLKRWNSYNIFGPKPVTTQLNSGGGEIPPIQSEIRQGWWIDRKNNYTAAIRMDENSVGGILNGKVMESRILITNFTFNPTDFDKLNYIEVKATRSPTQ